MRRPKGTSQGWVGSLGVIVTLLLVPLLAAAAPTSRSERHRIAKDQLERADRLKADLDGTPQDKRQEKDYLNVIRLYRRVYDVAPFSSLAADALAAAAEMYHDMGKQFDRKYWVEAIDTYQFLRREYPHSRYSDDALFNVAQIQHIHLEDTQTALATYRELLKTYAGSRHAPKAKERVRQIEAEQAAEKAAAKPETPAAATTQLAGAGARVQVRNIRYWNTKNFTRVVVDLDDEIRFQEGRIDNPDRIFFDLFNTELSTVIAGKSFEVADGLLDRIRVAENRAGVTRVVLEVNSAEDYSVFSLPNPFRLVVDIRGPARAAGAQKTPAEQPGPVAETPKEAETARASLPQPPPVPQPTKDGSHTLTRALGLKIGRIVLDPGHGGHDTGTIGSSGFMEKDLALDVARRLGKLLGEQLGAEVIFTREDDTFVPLENRIAVANEKQADLFLSIHANSSRNRTVRGVETFYLNVTNDPEALELAARENALAQKTVHELQDLVRKITRNEKLGESRELAREIQRSLHAELRKLSRETANRGVKQAPFVVLIGANMPSVLAEVAFLSNPDDEELLKSPQGRQAVAEALLGGMTEYMKNMNSVAFARSEEKENAQQ
ncbi:MAG: N-acetylmuramoyl-L-alanine amidase [Acidobacteria bacterium]|nr:N-acetylmuramoyl-L-alanine amidase [Acidobacteriota bacterium]